MKLGSAVYAGTARFEGYVTGLFDRHASVRLVHSGAIRVFERRLVATRTKPPKFAVGDEVTIVVDETACRGVVTCSRPLRAKVTDGHKVWHGCEVGSSEAVITKEVAVE